MTFSFAQSMFLHQYKNVFLPLSLSLSLSLFLPQVSSKALFCTSANLTFSFAQSMFLHQYKKSFSRSLSLSLSLSFPRVSSKAHVCTLQICNGFRVSLAFGRNRDLEAAPNGWYGNLGKQTCMFACESIQFLFIFVLRVKGLGFRV